MRNFIKRIPLALLVVMCLTLGLAPFTPEPHLLEKIKMLVAGELVKLIDIFDLVLHGSPWALLILKLYFLTTKSKVEIRIEDKCEENQPVTELPIREGHISKYLQPESGQLIHEKNCNKKI
jgi:hypothetical protein